MPYSAVKIANNLLRIAALQGATIDPLKLIKLTYISHGWSFAHYDRPLLTEGVQAWQYGPVVPTLYHAIKQYKYRAVEPPIAGDDDAAPISSEDDSLLEAVYNVYGKYSGGQLSNLTHKEGTPWAIIWHEYGQNHEIPNELIAKHYRALAGK